MNRERRGTRRIARTEIRPIRPSIAYRAGDAIAHRQSPKPRLAARFFVSVTGSTPAASSSSLAAA